MTFRQMGSGIFLFSTILPGGGDTKCGMGLSGDPRKSSWRNPISTRCMGLNSKETRTSSEKELKTKPKRPFKEPTNSVYAKPDSSFSGTEPSRIAKGQGQIRHRKQPTGNPRLSMDEAPQTRKTSTSAPTHSQSLMLEQLAASRQKISSRLSDANKYISYMERRVEDSNATIQEAFDCTEKVIQELGTLSQMAQSAATIAKFGVNRDDAFEKLTGLQKRIEGAQKAMAVRKDSLDALVPRRVPISWSGVAKDVRIMGSFDNWTRGFELSVEETSESVLAEFTTDLDLMPGTYDVKFIVNGEWKTAPDWPTVVSSDGSINNVIVVD